MFRSDFFSGAKLAVADFTRDRDWMGLWETYVLPIGLPLLLGLGMGILLAFLIVNQLWYLVFGLLLLSPVVVLLSAYPFAGLIVWILIMPFLQTTPNTTYRYVYWMIHRALPPITLGALAFAHLFKVRERYRSLKLGRAELAVAIYLGWAVANVFWHHSSPLAYLYLLYDRVFVPICLYWIVRLAMPRERGLKRLIPVACLIALFECIVGVLGWYAPQLLPQDWLRYQGARTTGTLAYPHAYTTTLIFLIFFLFQDAMNRKPGGIRSVLVFVFGLGAICVFLSFSRGSWLGGVVAAIGLLVVYPKKMAGMVVVLLVLMIILGSGALSDTMAFARQRMNSEDTAEDRLVIWNAGLRMAAAKPLWGWGFGDYVRYAWRFQTRVHNTVRTSRYASHNSYIAIAAETGLPALFLFVFPMLWWLTLSFRVWPRMPATGFWSRNLLVVFWLAILNHVVVNMFSDMRHSTYGMGMWWIALGFVANMVSVYLQSEDVKLPEWVQRAHQTS
jgi:O-antigen ligase